MRKKMLKRNGFSYYLSFVLFLLFFLVFYFVLWSTLEVSRPIGSSQGKTHKIIRAVLKDKILSIELYLSYPHESFFQFKAYKIKMNVNKDRIDA
jgi:hypothetical protein